MFENIGKKIKAIARVSFWFWLISDVVTAIILFVAADSAWNSDGFIFGGLGCLVFGPFLSLAVAYLIFGFGELIDKVCDIEKSMRNEPAPVVSTPSPSTSAPQTHTSHSNSRWICKTCETKNNEHATSCKYCGAKR